MLRELRKVPIPDADNMGKSIFAVLIACIIVGLISHVISWVILGFAVYAAIAAIAECERYRKPEKYTQGLLGFGSELWLDDATGAAAGLVLFIIAAFLDLYFVAAILTAVAAFAFFAARDIQRDAEREKEYRDRY